MDVEEEEDIKVKDLVSAVKVLRLLSEKSSSNQAYFKKSAVDEIIEYLDNRIKDLKSQFRQGNL